MKNTSVVDTTSKYIVKSTGIGSETNEELVDAEELTGGTDGSIIFWSSSLPIPIDLTMYLEVVSTTVTFVIDIRN